MLPNKTAMVKFWVSGSSSSHLSYSFHSVFYVTEVGINHLPELTGRVGPSETLTRWFCWTERAAHDQTVNLSTGCSTGPGSPDKWWALSDDITHFITKLVFNRTILVIYIRAIFESLLKMVYLCVEFFSYKYLECFQISFSSFQCTINDLCFLYQCIVFFL